MAGEEIQPQTGAPESPQPAAPAPSGGLGERLDAALGGQGTPEPAGAPPATPVQAPAAQQQPAPTAAEWQGVRDYARAQGYELPWPDDTQALNHLIQGYRQLQERNYYAELGQSLAPHAEAVQAYIAKQQAPAPAEVPAYRPPPFRREWLSMVETDPETGVLRSKPGYDPRIPEQVQAYADWRDRFLQEPETVIGPLVEERARAIVREEQAQYQEQVSAQGLVNQEAGWIFEGGRPGGRLTPAGQLYGRAAQHFYQSGLKDVRALHAASVALVQNAFLRQQLAAGRQAPAPAAPPQTPAMAGELPTSVGGALARGGSGAPPRPVVPVRNGPPPSLRELLSNRLNADVPAGVGWQ